MSIGTPDYTRGVVNAQKLLEAASAATHVIVSPPPNTESVILISGAPSSAQDVVWCMGQSSSAYAPVYRLPASNGTNFNGAWIFDVTNVIDTSYEIYYSNGSSTRWWVYADAAARLVVDGSKLVNQYGQQYVIPSVPGLLQNDHPPIELEVTSNDFSANGILVAAPGNTQRVRVFALAMGTVTAGLWGYLQDTITGGALLLCAGPGNVALPVPLTGRAMGTNAALKYVIGGGSGTMLTTAYYTVENV